MQSAAEVPEQVVQDGSQAVQEDGAGPDRVKPAGQLVHPLADVQVVHPLLQELQPPPLRYVPVGHVLHAAGAVPVNDPPAAHDVHPFAPPTVHVKHDASHWEQEEGEEEVK